MGSHRTRLISAISVNWAGISSESVEIMFNLLRNTRNNSGLTVDAFYIENQDEKRKKYSDRDMESINIDHWFVVTDLTYTIHP